MKINSETSVTNQYTQPAQKTENPQKLYNKFVADSIEISEEGKLNARKEQDNSVNAQAQLEMMQKQIEAAQEQGKAMSDAMEVQIKCMTIAMHIIGGDNVTQEDHKYLSEKDMELYMKAISMRIEKEKPEDCERISKDEEEENSDSSEEESTIKGGAGMVETKTQPTTETNIEGENITIE